MACVLIFIELHAKLEFCTEFYIKWFIFLMPSTQVLKALLNHPEGPERRPGASQPQLYLWEGNGENNIGKNQNLQIILRVAGKRW